MLRKLTALLVILAATALAGKAFRITDAETQEPLAAASIFNSKGVMIGITDAEGRFDGGNAVDYPLTVRYLGYTPATLDADKDASLSPSGFDLQEFTVTDRNDGFHLVCYVREYSGTTSAGDTMNFFKEAMVDYLVPMSKKVKKFKKHMTPRIRNARNYASFSRPGQTDSIVSNFEDVGYSWISMVGINGVNFKESDSLKSLGNYEFVNADSVQVRRNAGVITLYKDYLAGHKNHTYSPSLLKLLGMTIEFTTVDNLMAMPAKEDSTYRLYDLASLTQTVQANVKGKLLKWAYRSKDPLRMNSLIEVYPVYCRSITAEESREIDKDKDQLPFELPSAVPELPEPTRRLVEKAGGR